MENLGPQDLETHIVLVRHRINSVGCNQPRTELQASIKSEHQGVAKVSEIWMWLALGGDTSSLEMALAWPGLAWLIIIRGTEACC